MSHHICLQLRTCATHAFVEQTHLAVKVAETVLRKCRNICNECGVRRLFWGENITYTYVRLCLSDVFCAIIIQRERLITITVIFNGVNNQRFSVLLYALCCEGKVPIADWALFMIQRNTQYSIGSQMLQYLREIRFHWPRWSTDSRIII